LPDLFKTIVGSGKRNIKILMLSLNHRMSQTGPAFQRVETETAFIAQPTFVHFDITSADSAVDLSLARRVPGYAPTDSSGRMIDP
jgi:hypothetical protein